MTDNDFICELLKRGYKVPKIVIYSWGAPKQGRITRRIMVERWLKHKPWHKRKPPFPQFLAYFDIDLKRNQ
jgi:hypothetical protein